MKITREEFKELVALHEEMQKKVNVAVKFINEDVACDLAFILFEWIEEKLGIKDEYFDLLWDWKHGLSVRCKTEINGQIFYGSEETNDLDRIYDDYIADPTDIKNKENVK